MRDNDYVAPPWSQPPPPVVVETVEPEVAEEVVDEPGYVPFPSPAPQPSPFAPEPRFNDPCDTCEEKDCDYCPEEDDDTEEEEEEEETSDPTDEALRRAFLKGLTTGLDVFADALIDIQATVNEMKEACEGMVEEQNEVAEDCGY